MTYAIVYSSRTGNTERLAQALRQALPAADCLYYGPPSAQALSAERIYAGFWTDKGVCDGQAREFLATLQGKEVFLFGTAGFGGSPDYFQHILQGVAQALPSGNRLIGSFMCQGKMPMTVRERYMALLAQPDHAPNLEKMIENFDLALNHPNQEDLERLQQTAKSGYSGTPV